MPQLVLPRYLRRGALLGWEDFAAADSTNLSGYVGRVWTWTVRRGTWDIQTRRAGSTGSAPGQPQWIATADMGTPDVEIQAVGEAGAGTINLILRYDAGTGNHYLLNVQATSITLSEWTGAAYVTLLTETSSRSGSGKTIFGARIGGGLVEGWVQGGPRIRALAPNYGSATHHGIRASAASARFSDIWAWRLR